MTYDINTDPGDGIGPEVTTAAQRVLEAVGLSINWDIQNAGSDVHGSIWHTTTPICSGVHSARTKSL